MLRKPAEPQVMVSGLAPQEAMARLEQFGGYQELGSDWPCADTSKRRRQVKQP
jgi:hypothetical protein